MYVALTWHWYAYCLRAVRTRSHSSDSSNLHLILLPLNQLPEDEYLHWIGTVAGTLTSCTVGDIKFSHKRHSRFRITLSETIENVVGEYGPSSVCEGWLLKISVQEAGINIGLSIAGTSGGGRRGEGWWNRTCYSLCNFRNSREGKSTSGMGNPCAPHPLNKSLFLGINCVSSYLCV